MKARVWTHREILEAIDRAKASAGFAENSGYFIAALKRELARKKERR